MFEDVQTATADRECPHPATDAAFEQLRAGLDALTEIGDSGDFDALTPTALGDLLREFESMRNRLSVVDHALIAAAERQRLWEHVGARNTAGALREIIRIPLREAKQRVAAAEDLGTRSALTGEPMPPVLEHAARAQRDGAISATQSGVVSNCIRELRNAIGSDHAQLGAAEQSLVEYAAAFDPDQLRKVANKIVDVIVPDGRPPRDALVNDRRGIVLGRERADGSCTLTGTLTKSLRAKLFAVTSPLAAPRPADESGPDRRTGPQRMHDAFEDMCDRVLREGELPRSAGNRASVMIVAQLDDLLAQLENLGTGRVPPPRSTAEPAFTTVDGRIISIDELLHLAANAEIIPVYMSTCDGVVAYGRTRRFATPAQMKALIARDGGCSFPGCDAPPEWTEAHHILSWMLGGKTDLENLTLLCGYNHREFANQGWECRMINGRPHWIPPRWIDPEQRPLQNNRLATHPLSPDQVADLAERLTPPEPDEALTWYDDANISADLYGRIETDVDLDAGAESAVDLDAGAESGVDLDAGAESDIGRDFRDDAGIGRDPRHETGVDLDARDEGVAGHVDDAIISGVERDLAAFLARHVPS